MMLKVRKLEARASSMTSDLSQVKGSLESLAGQSDKVLGEVNRLKSHTQRSVDTSAGLRTNMIRVEGKLQCIMMIDDHQTFKRGIPLC